MPWAFLTALFTAASVQAAPPALHVSGNQVQTASGCSVTFKGVNVDGLEYSSNGQGPPGGNGGNTLTVAQMAVTGWHCNVIRLPLNQDYWFGCGGASQSTYQNIISGIVNYCSGQGAYVILDLHWSGTSSTASAPCGSGWGNAASTKQQPMADANAVTFWASVASAYANNPAVLFDLYNEPFDSGNDNLGPPIVTDTAGYSTWLNGGTLGGASFSTPGMQKLLNSVRSAGATNICLLGGLHWCANLNGLPASSVTNTGAGVMFATHLYGNNDGNAAVSWNAEVPSSLRSNYPIFVGEYGPSTNCNADDATFDSNMFSWLSGTSGVAGGTAWSFHTSSCPNLLSDWSFNPSTWGTAEKNFLATVVPTCAGGSPVPTGTPTRTPTATPTTVPPSITLTKTTGGPTSGYQENGTNIPMTILVCNAAGSVTANGVTVVDNVVNPLAWTQNGPNFSQWAVTVSGTPVTINPLNTSGFPITWVVSNLPGGVCAPINFNVIAYSFNASDSCQVVSDYGVARWSGGGPVTSNTIGITVMCAATNTPTATATKTSTPTSTPSYTLTSTPTRTNSPTGTPTSTATKTNTPTNSATLTPTNTPAVPTNTQTATASSTPTKTNSPTSTNTNTPTPSPTPTSTFSSTSTSTATNSATRTASMTPTASLTATPSATPTRTFTSTATVTATFTYTSTRTPTPTSTPTLTASFTSTSTSTFTPTQTYTRTSTFTPTITPTFTLTPTGTLPPTNTPTQTGTNSATSTATHTFTPTATVTSTFTRTFTPTASNTGTNTSTPSPTRTPTSTASTTPTASATLTATPSASPTRTSTLSSTSTATSTATRTNTPTFTFSSTLTATLTATNSATRTFTATSTDTSTLTHTPTITPTFTDSPTGTLSPSMTPTPSSTPTRTGTSTNTSTFTNTATPTRTFTTTATSSFTPTTTSTFTSTATPSASPTRTYTPTSTATPTPVAIQVANDGAAPGGSYLQGTANVPVIEVVLTNPSSSNVTLTGLTLTETGNPASNISSLTLFRNGALGPVAGFSGSTATFSGLTMVLPPNVPVTFTVQAAFTVNAATGNYSFGLTSGTATNGQAAMFNNLPMSGAVVTIVAASPTPTSTPIPTATFTRTFTPTSTPTFTYTPSFTSTATVTSTRTSTATPTAAEKDKPVIYPNPSDGRPVQVLPSPFTGTSDVTVDLFTTAFRRVRHELFPNQAYGPLTVELVDDWGHPLASGLYYVVVQTKNGRSVGKVLVIR